jgi:tetratricopeptide (TPR) repeat protein
MKKLIIFFSLGIFYSCANNSVDIFDLREFARPYFNSGTDKKISESKIIAAKANYLYRKDKNYLKASEQYISAIKVYPDPEYYYDLGNCYIDLKDYNKAIRSYKVAIGLGSNDKMGLFYYNCACAFSLNNNENDALAYLEKALINNYPYIEHITHDFDLKNISNTKRFKELITEYDTNLSNYERRIIGIWQNSPHMASGWGDTFTFYPNRKIISRYSQMDCSKRIISKTGLWKISNNVLHIEFNNQKEIVGGKEIPSDGSCGSETQIEGGQIVDKELESEIVDYSISFSISKNNKLNIKSNLPSIEIDNIIYWRHRSNPEDYH